MKDKDGERKKEAESAGLEQMEQSFLQMFEGATLTWNLATDVLITHTDTHTFSFFSHIYFLLLVLSLSYIDDKIKPSEYFSLAPESNIQTFLTLIFSSSFKYL